MKKSQRRRLHVLCEDPLTVDFVERLAERFSIGRRELKIESSPASRGSAVAYVLDHYEDAVRRWRAARHRDERVGFIVVIDGDNRGIVQRREDLARKLRDAKLEPIGPSDPVAILVPTWHVETWIAWLCGHRPLNEHTRYNGRDAAGLDVHHKIERGKYTPKLAVDAWMRPAPDEGTHVPSLATARAELKQRLGV